FFYLDPHFEESRPEKLCAVIDRACNGLPQLDFGRGIHYMLPFRDHSVERSMPNKAKVKTRPQPSSKARVKPSAKLSKPVHKSGHTLVKPTVRSGPSAHGTKAAPAKGPVKSKGTVHPIAAKHAPAGKAGPSSPQKLQVQPISGALKALETGIKLMYAEQYDKAIKCFHALI